jgi:hypothetical protein
LAVRCLAYKPFFICGGVQYSQQDPTLVNANSALVSFVTYTKKPLIIRGNAFTPEPEKFLLKKKSKLNPLPEAMKAAIAVKETKSYV